MARGAIGAAAGHGSGDSSRRQRIGNQIKMPNRAR
jgi:hypothetical protein